MKKLGIVFLFALAVMFITGCSKMDPVQDVQDENVVMKRATKAPDFNGAHFELNILGKKNGWNDNTFDNPDRHTMFVPAETEGWTFTGDDGVTLFQGVQINMTQGEEFAVLDGNAFDADGDCDFQLGKGYFSVWICAKAKPTDLPPQIDGWLQAYDNQGALWYYLNVGMVQPKRTWTDATGLFMITPTEATPLPWPDATIQQLWIFDYMKWLDSLTYLVGDVPTDLYSNLLYFWQLQNNGTKLIKVRFYPV